MPRAERLDAIRKLQAERDGTVVITYLTSTRPNLESIMAMDVIPVIYRHLTAITTGPENTRIDLLLSSNGGDGVVPWKLAGAETSPLDLEQRCHENRIRVQ